MIVMIAATECVRGNEIPINGVEVARAWMRARRARAVDINGQTLVRVVPEFWPQSNFF